MSPELQNILTNIAFGLAAVAVIAFLIWIMNYDNYNHGGLLIGDKFIDKRWKQTKLEILGFAQDGSGWIRVRITQQDGSQDIIDMCLESIYDYYERVEEVNREDAE